MEKKQIRKKAKLQEWLKRYLPAEILSVLATLGAAGLTFQITGDAIKTALAGTWGGNVTYFGYILFADILRTKRHLAKNALRYNIKDLTANIKALAVEFGFAEVLDSFLIRPLLMYYLPIWFGSLSWGILVAKFVADVTFYIPAIISYEFSKKHFRNYR
jgi:hypothetical protein